MLILLIVIYMLPTGDQWLEINFILFYSTTFVGYIGQVLNWTNDEM